MEGVTRAALHGAHRRQRRLATAAVLLWIVGFELLPGAHLVLHDDLAAHHHDGDDAGGGDGGSAASGLRVTIRTGELPHRELDGAWHTDAGAPRSAEHERAGETPGRPHGQHSLAHRGIAVHTPPPVLTTPLPVTRQVAWLVAETETSLRSLAALTAVARGPPGC
jgi:hypothetical protein